MKTPKRIIGLILAAFLFGLFSLNAVGCSSSDDPTDGDVDGDTTPPDGDAIPDGDVDGDQPDGDGEGNDPVKYALGLLGARGDDEELEVWVYPKALSAGAKLEAYLDSSDSFDVVADSWLLVLDRASGALYGHPMDWVSYPTEGAKIDEHESSSPPENNKLSDLIFLGASFNKRGQSQPAASDKADDEAKLDYGDAPEGQEAYIDSVKGNFPVGASADGARTASCETLRLGKSCNQEKSPRLVDRDSDDGVIWMIAPAAYGGQRLFAHVSVDDVAGAPVAQYLNVLVDFDRDGKWDGDGEWAIKHRSIGLEQGEEKLVEIAVPVPAGSPAACGGMWVRVLLSDTDIGEQSWTGTGSFAMGEVEDLFVPDSPDSSGNHCHPIILAENVQNGDGNNTTEDACGVESGKHALIIAGTDRTGEAPIVANTARYMQTTLSALGFETEIVFPGSDDDWEDDIDDLGGKVKCLDEVLVYIVAHGLVNDGVGIGEMRLSDGDATTSAAIFTKLNQVATCLGGRLEEGECEAIHSACEQTLVVESSFSGSQSWDLEKFSDKTGRRFVFSSMQDQASWTGLGIGLVARAIQKAFSRDAEERQAADADDDGKVSQKELGDFIKAEVVSASGARKQDPTHTGEAADCACTCCGDGLIQDEYNEVCEKPGNFCDPGDGACWLCDDECQCSEPDGDIDCNLDGDGDGDDDDDDDFDDERPPCVCSPGDGPCCNGCYYRKESHICDPGVEILYNCIGDFCGGTLQRKVTERACSGSSSDCSGDLIQRDWTDHKICNSAQVCDDLDENRCLPDDSGTCTCECDTEGLCCDGCDFRSPDTICEAETLIEYDCFGEECGGILLKQTTNRHCSGDSILCADGAEVKELWQDDKYCQQHQTCDAELADCVDAAETCCECSGGVCCEDNCNFDDISKICAEDIAVVYTCLTGECGDTVYKSSYRQRCTGDNAECAGEPEALDPVIYKQCAELEMCTAATGECEESIQYCCECSTGDCCDGCNFLGTDQTCREAFAEYTCTDDECGGSLSKGTRFQHCSGYEAECDGLVDQEYTWTVEKNCLPEQSCNAQLEDCVADDECPCQCTAGECCDGCRYVISSEVCNPEAAIEYRCATELCGSLVEKKVTEQYCPGDGADCTGTELIGEWDSHQQCGYDSLCNAQTGACDADQSCTDCECTRGVCCDGCHYRLDDHVCDDGDPEYRCVGEGCGAVLESRSIVRYCTGDNEDCPVAEEQTDWAVEETCSSGQLCNAELGVCVHEASCVCDCFLGACCDGCSYSGTEVACDDDWDEEFRCTDPQCGGNLERRAIRRYCPGNSTNCLGEIIPDVGWDLVQTCPDSKGCRISPATGLGACQDVPMCLCDCLDADDPCCDGCDFEVADTKCDIGIEVQLQCLGDCGGSLQQKTLDQVCTGDTAQCTGATSWSDWNTISVCSDTRKCSVYGMGDGDTDTDYEEPYGGCFGHPDCEPE